MIDRCYSGGHEFTTTWIPDGTPAGKPPLEWEDVLKFDVDAAKTLLEGAGGIDRDLVLIVRQGTESECAGQFIQESLRTNLGVTANLEALEGPVRSARFREETFDLFPGGWIQDYPDPENWILGLFDTGGTLNNYNCSMQEIDDLVDKARFNTNDTERKQQYADINELISTHACGIAPYWHENNHWLIKQNVVGMRENMAGQDGAMPGDWAAEAWGLAP
jgi:ABC-type oligopeptide transport system substrate-binding subunit